MSVREFDRPVARFPGDIGLAGAALDPETWREVGGPGNPLFASPWAQTLNATIGRAAFRRLPSGLIVLKGGAERASGGTGRVFTLPETYRPARSEYFSQYRFAGSIATGIVEIKANGEVHSLQSGTFISLAGIAFAEDE
jgi:hypothetical protein